MSSIDYDLIIVIGQNASLVPILKEAEELKINPDKVILDRTICVPSFTLERYKKLRKSKLSIFAKNCWGGNIYHRFGLQFLTPTINMFTSDEGFLRFLKNPQQDMKEELILEKMQINPDLNINYPVFSISNTSWYMNHYPNVEIAKQKWQERKKKINWFNLLVMMYTDDSATLKEFDKLPYAKKVCFVPFKTELDSGFYIEPEIVRGRAFWQPVNETSSGLMNYDLWDLLLYGKKTPLQIKNN